MVALPVYDGLFDFLLLKQVTMAQFTIHHILSLTGREYLLSRFALRLLKIIEPYLLKQERMANAQLLRYGSKQTDQNSSNSTKF
jgi:hypothetical protein